MLPKSNADIQDYIDSFCSQVGWDGESIAFSLSTATSRPDGCWGVIADNEPTLIVTDRLWTQPDPKDQLDVHMCLLLAKLKFENHELEVGSPEWRYYAFKCGLLEHKGEVEFNSIRVLVDEW